MRWSAGRWRGGRPARGRGWPWRAGSWCRIVGAVKTIGVLGGIGPQATMDFEQFEPHVARTSGRPVLGLIDEVLRDVRRRGWRKVGVLG